MEVLTVRKYVAYSAIYAFAKKLPKAIDAAVIEAKARKYAKARMEALTRKYAHWKNKERAADMVRGDAMADTRVYICSLMAQGTKKQHAQLISEHFHIKFTPGLLDKVMSLAKGRKASKNEKTGKEYPAMTGAQLLAGRACTALIPREAKTSDRVVNALRVLFASWFEKFFLAFVPPCDKVTATPIRDEKGNVVDFRDVVFLNEVETGESIEKERKAKVLKPVAFAPRCVETHYGKVYPDTAFGVDSPFHHVGSIAQETKLQTRKDEQGNEYQVKVAGRLLPTSLGYVAGVSYSWEWKTTTDENGKEHVALHRVKHESELRTVLQPCAWEETTEIEKYSEAIKRQYVTHADKKGLAKLVMKGKDITLKNGGKYVMGSVVQYITFLFDRYKQDIPEDKTLFVKQDGKVFKTFNRHVPRFGLFDVINDACLALWSEMLQRVVNKEKQFTEEEFVARAKTVANTAFMTRLRDSKRLDSLEMGIDERESNDMTRDGSASQYVTLDKVSRAYAALSEYCTDEDSWQEEHLDVADVPLGYPSILPTATSIPIGLSPREIAQERRVAK